MYLPFGELHSQMFIEKICPGMIEVKQENRRLVFLILVSQYPGNLVETLQFFRKTSKMLVFHPISDKNYYILGDKQTFLIPCKITSSPLPPS
uniref:Uncharacterized protein n=1 Tax=Romanomermis culicivorax TaxID=13658 RepID=A0A915JSS3_ROMCU